MNEVVTHAVEGDLDLGLFLGRTQAFGLIAGRCSAAQAMCLREIHEKKLYKQRCPDWNQFCREYLHIARVRVQQIIGLLNEFGPEYFELSQLTRVSAETYRAIQPAIRDGSLHAGNEAIALIPANAARISAAVSALRNNARKPRAGKDRLAALEQQCSLLVTEFDDMAGDGQYRPQLKAVLGDLRSELRQLELKL
jgi:hypothetical protein